MRRLSGFSLIEITFGLLISSILSVMLFQVNGTLSRLSQSIESSLAYIRTVPLMAQQLERDISAIYVPMPIYSIIARSWKEKKAGLPDKKEQGGAVGVGESADKQEDDTASADVKKKDKDSLEKWKPVEPFFCEVVDDEKLNISLITTTTLPSFQRTVPRLVRVDYRVLPDAEFPGTFKVWRSQSFDIFGDVAKEGDIQGGDVLVSGIESLKVRMIGAAKKEGSPAEKDSTKSGEEPSEQPSLSASEEATRWNKKDAEEKFASLLPLAVEFEGVLRSGPGGRTHSFFFSIPIAASFGSMVELHDLSRNKSQESQSKDKDPVALQKDENSQK